MEHTNTSKLTVIAVLCSVIFFLALTLFEAVPEIPVDIDLKPFFIPLAFVALVPKGMPVVAVSLGAMLGEFLRDLLEGYELDDPIGAIGYVVGFVIAGYIVGSNPLNKFRLFIAAMVSGLVHAVIEATSFLIFSTETWSVALWSAAGNTITDGLLGGAIPLILIMPHLYGRVERYFGFAPRGKSRRRRSNRQVSAS
ncbi:MAG: hypothetical protein WBF90_29520 [Rivularia sp. (in: cyanobacteria)]